MDKYILIRGIEVYVPDRCGLAGERRGNRDAFKVWWDDQVDVLTWVGEESHH